METILRKKAARFREDYHIGRMTLFLCLTCCLKFTKRIHKNHLNLLDKIEFGLLQSLVLLI